MRIVAPTKRGCRTVLKMLSRVIIKVKCEQVREQV